ncbi:MAG: VCBS repeat-containing protein [Candidatus Hydrogenedentes bacterium]|nr:VCBS repeat-containing protein [Candidatus Hydrogenedentota bacterium]
MIAAAIAIAAALGALFDVHTIPLDAQPPGGPQQMVQTLWALADNDAVADLLLLQGNKLTTFLSTGEIRETQLPAGVSAIDVADIDGDGHAEIIAVQGKAVLRCALALPGDAKGPVKLFEADSLYALAPALPTPAVIVQRADDSGKWLVTLPTAAGLERRSLDGTPVDASPYAESRHRTENYTPKSYRDSGSLHLGFSAESEFYLAPRPTEEAKRKGDETIVLGAGATATGLRHASNDDAVNWPWFAVRTDKAKMTRAYCAVEESLNTLVRMCDVAIDAGGTPAGIAVPGPERRYPGAMVPVRDTAPDFNGDGYADLLLWNAPRPGISVDALLRAVVGRNWPMTLTVHLYSPDKGRFEPMPATELVYRIPVTWFLTGGVPLRHYVLADFNGDKKTDLAMCTAENEYAVWLYTDGFPAVPDETHTFTENITGIELTGDIASNGKTSIVLRSTGHIYALHAK